MHALFAYDGPPEPSGGLGVGLLYLLLFGGLGLWLWRRKVAADSVLTEGDLDWRIGQRFAPGGVFHPENMERRRPFRRYYWAGLVLAAIGLIVFATDIPAFFAWFLVIWGLGLSGWMFFHSLPPDHSAPAWTNFQPDHLVVTNANEVRSVFVLGPRVTISLSCARVPVVFLAKAPANPHRFFMTVSEGGSIIRLPLEFAGSGEYLASCRKEGVTLVFAEGTPAWFIEEMKRLPSWQRSYFNSTKDQPQKTIMLVCVTCGGSGSYDAGRNNHSCQFCGSAELRASFRK
jgi:hypothetical protein